LGVIGGLIEREPRSRRKTRRLYKAPRALTLSQPQIYTSTSFLLSIFLNFKKYNDENRTKSQHKTNKNEKTKKQTTTSSRQTATGVNP